MKFMVIIACAIGISLEAMDKKKHEKIKSFGVGVTAGTVEILVNQQWVVIKNYLLERRTNPNAKMPRTIKDFYRGFSANMLGIVPTTGAQMMAYDIVSAMVDKEESSIYKSLVPVVASGFAGAIFAGPVELVIIRQNKDQIPLLTALKCTVQEQGVAKLLGRGFIATALRDTGFAKGMLEGHPWAKEKLITAFPSMPSTAASLISGVVVGAFVVGITHPFETIKYKQQSFVAGSIADACRLTYQQGGFRAFFDGVTARSTRVMSAILVMSETREKLNNLINKP